MKREKPYFCGAQISGCENLKLITIVKGTISVYADGEMIGQLNSGGHADISSIGAGVSIVFNGSTKSGFKRITLDGGAFSQFKIHCLFDSNFYTKPFHLIFLTTKQV